MVETSPNPRPAPSATELALRWERARAAAKAQTEGEPDALLRKIYDNSYLLGRSFSYYHRVDPTLRDLERMLPHIASPCLDGLRAQEDGRSLVTHRPPCAHANTPTCNEWREAIGGLVSGLCSMVYHTRLSSGTAGGVCSDLFHLDARTPTGYLPIPAHLQVQLEEFAAKVARVTAGARFEALGMREGGLVYTLHAPTQGCALDNHELVRRMLARTFPDLPMVDASSRPVLSQE
jgi:hypothetical protein